MLSIKSECLHNIASFRQRNSNTNSGHFCKYTYRTLQTQSYRVGTFDEFSKDFHNNYCYFELKSEPCWSGVSFCTRPCVECVNKSNHTILTKEQSTRSWFERGMQSFAEKYSDRTRNAICSLLKHKYLPKIVIFWILHPEKCFDLVLWLDHNSSFKKGSARALYS